MTEQKTLPKTESKELLSRTLAWLEPEGNFTHMAALGYQETIARQTEIHLVGVKSIAEIFKKINTGEVDWAIVPIENSTDGHIKDTLKGLSENDGIFIVDEYVVPVQLSFVMRRDSKPKVIKSKDTVFGQASGFVGRIREILPDIELIPAVSTGAAVAEAVADPRVSAIGSKISAGINARVKGIPEESIMQIDDVQDNDANATRFVVISNKKEVKPIKKDVKTTLIMEINDQPGSLFSILNILKERGINLKQIKSFRKNGGAKVSFLVTVSGHEYQQDVYTALSEIEKHASVQRLGSYSEANYSPPQTEETVSITDDNIKNVKKEILKDEPRKKDEAIIIFTLQDKVGALHDVLESFAKRGINLTRIGSSPSTRGHLNEYIFYLGFENGIPQKEELITEVINHCMQLREISDIDS